MRLSSIGVMGSALVAGTLVATDVFAGGLSGSATFISPAGFTSTVSGEITLPPGGYYRVLSETTLIPGTPNSKAVLSPPILIVLPQFSLQGFSVAIESLSVSSEAVVTVLPRSSFAATAATILVLAAAAADPTVNGAEFLVPIFGRVYNSSNIEFISAIIKAGAGVNGLD